MNSSSFHLPAANLPGAAGIGLNLCLFLLSPLGLVAAMGADSGADLEGAPERIFHHGKVVTVDREFRIAEAFAVRGDRILAVGSNDEILKLKKEGKDTETIDLQGKMVLPGLLDSHTHPVGASMYEFDHPIPPMETVDDVLAYVRDRAKALPEGEWIDIRQVFITRLQPPRYPTREELDAAAPKHPVVFSTGPDSMLNSLALTQSGINRDTQAKGNGIIYKDPKTGEPTGLLRNASGHIKSHSSPGKKATEPERLDRLAALFRDYNAVGITGIADRSAGDGDLRRFAQLLEENRLSVRVVCSYGVDGQASVESAKKQIQAAAKHPLRRESNRLKIVGIKIFLDGGMLTGSAYMREPWGVSNIYSIVDPDYRGILFVDPEKLETLVRAAAEEKLQFTAHAVGDGAVHSLLEAYEKASESVPLRETRPCLTHSNFMSLEACQQMAKLGVVADIQPAWLYLDGKTLSTQFGEKRLRYFQPLATLFASGAVAGGGSDHMQKIGALRGVNPYHPFLGMWTTLKRQPRRADGPLHAEEALTREQAIRFYTGNNAKIMFLDDAGSLAAGKLADWIVVDRDLLTCDLDAIRETQVLETWLGGEKVYDRLRDGAPK